MLWVGSFVGCALKKMQRPDRVITSARCYGMNVPERARTMKAASPLLTLPSRLKSERKLVASAGWPERLRT